MRKITYLTLLGLFSLCIGSATAQNKSGPEWSLNSTIIEACSCPMFCQCYFNPKPAAHGSHDGHGAMGNHFCRFNNVFRVNKGQFGNVNLDGMEFWVAGDLGGDFSTGQMDWAVATFEPSATKQQREAVAAILAHLYPVKWKSFTVGKDAEIEWKATSDSAVARLDGGKAGEVVLKRYQGMTTEPIVIKNLRYWGAPRNDGFVLMPNEVVAYKVGDKPFEYKGTNGFMITFDISSKDVNK